GKTGTYYVKRFNFDDLPVGKRTKFIGEESKLITLTNNEAPVVALNILKGKSQTKESFEQLLTEIVDVKGMKAQGNRLSFHTVQKIKLLTEDVDLSQKQEVEVAEEAGEAVADSE